VGQSIHKINSKDYRTPYLMQIVSLGRQFYLQLSHFL
jgi:hypothetical protein